MIFEMTEHGFKTATSFGELDISGDDTYGFRPYQLMVSSIAVCSGGVMRKVLNKMRLEPDHIQVEVKEVVRNSEEADRIEKIHLHFRITGSQIDENKMPRVMELTKKNCSMVQSVMQSIEVNETYELLS